MKQHGVVPRVRASERGRGRSGVLVVVAALSLFAACGGSKTSRGFEEGRSGSAHGTEAGTTSSEMGGEGGADNDGRGGSDAAPNAGTGNVSDSGQGTGGSGQGNAGGTGGMEQDNVGGAPPTSGSGGTGGMEQDNVGGAPPTSGGGGSGGILTGGSGGAGASGGQPGGAPLPLPEGCEPRGQSEDADTCFLGTFCDGTPNLTNCLRLPSGRFQCSCELGNNDRFYEIEGAPGLEACAVAAGLCAIDELELGEETCEPRMEAEDDDTCHLELACERPITKTFAPDATAWLVRYGLAGCDRSAGGLPFICGCDLGDASYEYGVLADDGRLACRPLVDFCLSGEEPNFDEPTLCFETDQIADEYGCDLYQTCATPMRLTDDVSLARLEPRNARCSPTAADTSRCGCSDAETSFLFDLAAAPEAETCAASILNCADDVTITPQGDAVCEPTSQTSYEDSCEADLDCLQPATVDERSITARGRLMVHCRRATPAEPWWCSCASNQDTTVFELGAAGTSPFDVCGEAPARCLEEMSVAIGPYGDFVQPPDPLPAQ